MALPVPLQGFLQDLGQAWQAKVQSPGHLARLVQGDTFNYSQLQTCLQQLGSNVDYPQIISRNAGIPQTERANAFAASLLEYLGRHPRAQELVQGGAAGGYPSQVLQSAYDKWADVYSKASLVFQAQETCFFGPTLRCVGTTLVLLAIAADDSTRDPGQACITDAVSKISRSTGVAAIDRSPLPGEKTKRADVLWLANASFRSYFKLKNVRLCETVLGSVENALTLNRNFASQEQKSAIGEEDQGLICYSRADRVTYKYYLGRLRLSQHRLRKAYSELRWAFDNCTNNQLHNKRLILTHLVVVSLILGIYPARSLLAAFGLDDPFAGLIECIRRGDGLQVNQQLDGWREWHRKRGNYLLLKEKLPISIWRNLMRRSFLIARASSGLGAPSLADLTSGQPVKTPPPTLKLAIFLILARKAWNDSSFTVDDVECVVASLIDQGYVKAYAIHNGGTIVFRRTPDFGFTKVSSVY